MRLAISTTEILTDLKTDLVVANNNNNSGMGWLKPVNTVLLMLCSAVFVECLVLNQCCVVMFGMFCVMYGRITFSSVFAITDRRDIGLYDVPMLMSLFGLGIGMMFASFQT